MKINIHIDRTAIYLQYHLSHERASSTVACSYDSPSQSQTIGRRPAPLRPSSTHYVTLQEARSDSIQGPSIQEASP
ncbi:hypothetical protein BO70DRAFT_361529 [Aspergillus heteromorphus CBS 117.55]|uniref:Uncharacterized protein n=1 Tax=Aspergillus heteromorphus CBS 117.55 TaxID=1448321 RepID=A0A317WAP8_9EURO|nr:uncharacterized protein BO70DRAFT_361529 [Aspergillus heteromorphus CBS 117.55]PWY83413.1 hypothetical protein BO70DRAFT_361529 [Aspergillus heteromorphus CBS 117.55]